MSFDHSMAEEPKKPRRQSIISYFFALLVFALALTLTLAFGQPAPALQNPRSVPRARPRTPPVASDGVASRSLPTRAGETKEIVQPRSVNGTGKVHILVKVDSTDVVPESNENNNVTVAALMTALPDLVVPTVTLTPTTVTPGGGVVVGITLQNAGQGNTLNNFAYSIYLSTDSVLSAGDTLLSGPTFVGALTAGTSTGFSVGVSIPASTPTGAVFILVEIDSTDVIPEANEANNVTVAALMTALPDLVVPTVTLTPTTVTPGGGVVVGITLQNAGQGNTLNNFAYSIYLSTDSVLSAGDALLSGGERADEGRTGKQRISRTQHTVGREIDRVGEGVQRGALSGVLQGDPHAHASARRHRRGGQSDGGHDQVGQSGHQRRHSHVVVSIGLA